MGRAVSLATTFQLTDRPRHVQSYSHHPSCRVVLKAASPENPPRRPADESSSKIPAYLQIQSIYNTNRLYIKNQISPQISNQPAGNNNLQASSPPPYLALTYSHFLRLASIRASCSSSSLANGRRRLVAWSLPES